MATTNFQWTEATVRSMLKSRFPSFTETYIQRIIDEFKENLNKEKYVATVKFNVFDKDYFAPKDVYERLRLLNSISVKPDENKGWEIVAIRGLSTGFIYHKKEDGLFWNDSYNIDYYSPHHGCEAYSVKRLSDGLVFTVGDLVDSLFSSLWRIHGFKVHGNKMIVLYKESEDNIRDRTEIENLRHPKPKDFYIHEFEHKNCPDNPDLNYVNNGTGYFVAKNYKRGDKQKDLEWCLSQPSLRIKSVVRVSDWKKFTIGDLIRNKRYEKDSYPTYKPDIKITGFLFIRTEKELQTKIAGAISDRFNIGKMAVITDGHYCAQHLLSELELEPPKVKLFTTEDGVDIYQKQKVWSVCTANCASFKDEWDITEYPFPPRYYPESYKYFSTKEAAEEYVLLNKPCLSVNDVKALDLDITLPVPKGTPPNYDKEMVDVILFEPKSLIELAKQKIKI